MPQHPQIRSQKQRAIEEEFGMPFREVLEGFARDRYGCDTTARILDYYPSTFRQLLKRRGWTIPWPTLKNQIIMEQREPLSAETRAKIGAKQRAYWEKKRNERDSIPERSGSSGQRDARPNMPAPRNHPWRK